MNISETWKKWLFYADRIYDKIKNLPDEEKENEEKEDEE
jgi:hypothetical protein